jgi:formylglycine-generating enzyme required for sulfatase activity
MGSEEGPDREQPVHEVCVKQGFWLGRHEVMQRQLRKRMDENPAGF